MPEWMHNRAEFLEGELLGDASLEKEGKYYFSVNRYLRRPPPVSADEAERRLEESLGGKPTPKTAGATIIPDDRPMWTGTIGGPVSREERELKNHQEGQDTAISKGAGINLTPHLIGAGIGAVGGALAGGKEHRLEGALGGAVLGAGAGHLMSKGLSGSGISKDFGGTEATRRVMSGEPGTGFLEGLPGGGYNALHNHYPYEGKNGPTITRYRPEKTAEVSPAVTWDGTVRGGGKQVSQMPPFRMPSLRKEAFFSELAKLGAISDEEAAKALERYEALEKNKATPRQAARYGALGAVTAPVMSAVSDVVGGNPLFGGGSVKQRLRNVAGKAIGGAIGMGGLPLVRQHLDRQAEMNTLKSYMNQPHLEQERSIHTAGKLVAPFEVAEKTAFETSMYSGPLGPVSFRQSSGVPPMRVPSLAAPLEKKSYGEVEKAASTATTAAGRLASSMKVGLPKLTAPSGPSIAQVAKPVGFGKPLAGANKTTV